MNLFFRICKQTKTNINIDKLYKRQNVSKKNAYKVDFNENKMITLEFGFLSQEKR